MRELLLVTILATVGLTPGAPPPPEAAAPAPAADTTAAPDASLFSGFS